jgi:hypothetical protein
MANASHKTGSNPRQSQHGVKPAGEEAPGERLDEFDLASDIKGRNALQGESQARHLNEREAEADADPQTDDLLESFKKTDKGYRAESERLRRHERDAGTR